MRCYCRVHGRRIAKMKSIENLTLSGLKWTSLSKLAAQLISWGMTLVVLRLLAPSDYGLMAIVAVFVSLLTNIAELGLGASLVQSKELTKQEISGVTGVVVTANIVMFVCLVAAAPLIARIYAEPRLTTLIQVAALQLVFSAVVTVPQSLAYRDMQFRRLALTDLFAAVAGGAATIAMAWHGFGVWSLLLANVIQGLLRTLLLSWGRWPRATFRFGSVRSHLEFGSIVAGLSVASQLINQSDIMIAGRVLTQQALGLYSVSLHFATLPMSKIMGTINQVAFPAVAKLQREPERLRQRLLEATRLLMLITVPLLWGISCTAPEFVAVVMGAKWLQAVRPLQAICLVIPLQMLNAFYSTAALGVRDVRANLYNLAASATVLPGAFFVGAKWGVNGMAYAWLLAIPLVFALRLPGTMRSVGVRPRDLFAAAWSPFAAAGIMYLVVGASRMAVGGIGDFVRLVMLIGIGAGTYCAVVALIDRRALSDVARFAGALRR